MATDGYVDKAKQAREWGEQHRDTPVRGESIGKGQPAKTADRGKPGLDRDAAADQSVMGQRDVDESKDGILRRDTATASKEPTKPKKEGGGEK
jgi:hypothetical protein